MRIFIVGDLHYNLKNGNIEWFEIGQQYWDNFLLKTIIENKKEGDIVIFLGDIFDNRQNINIKIFNTIINKIKQLAQIIPVYIIIGNHDMYYKNTTEVTALDILDGENNIHLIKNPKIITLADKNIGLVSWIENLNLQQEAVDNILPYCDYLFGHLNIKNMYINFGHYKLIDGIEIKDKNKLVFTGHIHYRQEYENVYVVGNAYGMNWNDANNIKGIYILDTKDNNLSFIENKISPRFIKMMYNEIVNLSDNELAETFNNSFLNIYFLENEYDKLNQDTLIKRIFDVVPNVYKVELVPIYNELNDIKYNNKDVKNIGLLLNDINGLFHYYIKNILKYSDEDVMLYTNILNDIIKK